MNDSDSQFFLHRKEQMNDPTKPELLEKLPKLLPTDMDLNFLLSLDERDLTTLLIALRERMGVYEVTEH